MPHPSWDLFDGLPPDEVDGLLSLASPIALHEGEELFGLGDEANRIFLVVSGQVRLTLPLSVGERQVDVMVGERMPGHMVGWSGLIPPHRFTFKAVAVPDTELLVLARPPLLAFFNEKPHVGYLVYSNLARIVGQRLQLFQTMWVREMQHVVKTKTT
jgi:CRP/FNR family transcriptional regulator